MRSWILIVLLGCGGVKSESSPSAGGDRDGDPGGRRVAHGARRLPDRDGHCQDRAGHPHAWQYGDGKLAEVDGCQTVRVHRSDGEEWISCCPVGPPAELPLWLDRFPRYPGATEVCHEHVTGTGGHIEWWSYASADDDGSVASFITTAMRKTMSHEVAVDDLRLSVHAVDDPDYPRCQAVLPSGTRTMIVVSRMAR